MFCSRCGNALNEKNECPVCGGNNNTLPVKNRDNSKIYKIAILSFLVIIIVLLSILLFQKNDDKVILDDTPKTTLEENGNVSRTIMIYMVGSNLESDSGIATADISSIDPSLIDLDNMDILLYTGGTEKWHNFVSNEENAIYHLTSSGFEKIETYKKLNMGSSSTLASFLEYGYENYKNDRYDLIFYNHGGAIDGAIYDDFTNDNLSLMEFEEALDKSPFNSKNRLETVLFRTCLNGTLEVASIFDDYAYYLIASEEVTNGGGSTSVLNFLNDVTKDDTAIDYGKKYIEAYDEQMKHYILSPDHPKMYSIIDLNKISDLWKKFETFIDDVDIDNNYSDIVRLRDSLFQFGYSYYNDNNYDMVDLYSLVVGLDDYTSSNGSEVLELIDDSVIYNWSSSDNFHGLSVYFPYRGEKSIKNKFLNTYKKLEVTSNYKDFIKEFNDKNSSNKESSFASFSNKNEVKLENGNEFTLKLTDAQANDYANSIYILFSKNKDGLYRPIYSSDNAKIDNGYLKTNIADNLIRVRDTSDGTMEYLTVVERSKNDKKTWLTTSVLQYVPGIDEPLSSMKMKPVNVYFDFKDGTPYVTSYVSIGENGAAGSIENIEDYNVIDYFNTGYKIFDKDGKYTDDWDNNGEITGYEFKIKDVEYSKASIDRNSDYYCVFKIQDIYGNVYYSDFMSLK